jgi:tRNA modification GTPase
MADRDDTICAPATAPGEGAVGIVRVSGPDAVAVVGRRFAASSGLALGDAPSHTVHHGHLSDAAGDPVDEVLVLLMRAPRSYTREDVVEVQCHGGGAAVEAALESLVAAGARLAEPGEFTRRAFLNGRIDLTRAEAVLEVIAARTDAAHRLAQRQLGGALAARLRDIAADLKAACAELEAAIDFPDEDPDAESSAETADTLPARLESAREALGDVLARGRAGHLLREGVRLAILGRPNVGKSSLLNRLVGYDRAIVAAAAGTTRDVLEAELAVGGVRFVVQDTAGIRAPADPVEAEGVARSRRTAREADVALLVLDAADGLTPEDEKLRADLDGRPAVVAWNKCDLTGGTTPTDTPDGVPTSARTGDGLDALRDALVAAVRGPGAMPLEHAFLVTARQREALGRAAEALERANRGLGSGAFPELVAADARQALDALGEVTGATTTDDLLDTIFSRFCIGK